MRLLILTMLAALAASAEAGGKGSGRRCTPHAPVCTACRDCTACRYCSGKRNSATCSVCADKKRAKPPVAAQRRRRGAGC